MITKKMFASEKNCIFVNFYQEDDEPIFGLDNFFAKNSKFLGLKKFL